MAHQLPLSAKSVLLSLNMPFSCVHLSAADLKPLTDFHLSESVSMSVHQWLNSALFLRLFAAIRFWGFGCGCAALGHPRSKKFASGELQKCRAPDINGTPKK
jgi:hypothetical protein